MKTEVEAILDELRERGWAGGEHKSVAIHLEWDEVHVHLEWIDEARTEWGNTTWSGMVCTAPTLLEALREALEYATPNPPRED